MKQFALINLLFIILFSIICQAQHFHKRHAYLSANIGAYPSTNKSDNRTPVDLSRIGAGVGLGIHLIDGIYLYGKTTFISRSDFEAVYNNSNFETDFRISNNLSTVNASISQLVVNGGLQYNIYLSEEITFGIVGGITYSLVNQEVLSTGGSIIQKIDNQSLYGYFGGVSIEKNFKDRKFSLFAETLYNYVNDDMIYFRSVFSGINFTIGGRYYFTGG